MSHPSITFCGAAGQVTGSCHFLETGNSKLVVDCGMFQAGEDRDERNRSWLFEPSEIDAVLVTHAHLDHCGRIPKLVKDGFQGPIYMTKGTISLARLIWEDAEHIMQEKLERYDEQPLYNEQDIEAAFEQCIGVDYDDPVQLGGGETVHFRDAGHIFGSAFLEIAVDGKTIGFSGDLGNVDVPILRDTASLGSVDALVCETTYGDRNHEPLPDRKSALLEKLTTAISRGGTLMIPAFSLERTQELLYVLDQLSDIEHRLPRVDFYLDSPLAIDTLPTYRKYSEYYDADAMSQYTNGNDFLDFKQLEITRSTDESKQINDAADPKVVIAGAGMMNGGRILHHLMRYLPDPNSTLFIIGYQAEGTLGRKIYDGASEVTIMGNDIPVNCHIETMRSLSAHADRDTLLKWVSNAKETLTQVFCVHGEQKTAEAFAEELQTRFAVDAYVPEYGQKISLQ